MLGQCAENLTSSGPPTRLFIRMPQAKFRLLPHTEIDPSFEMRGRVAACDARDVYVEINKDMGSIDAIPGTTFKVCCLVYYQGEVCVAETYFYSHIALKFRRLDGTISEPRGCPYIFAVPIDSITARYEEECRRRLGASPAQAAVEQMRKDVVDALRLFADQWLGLAIVEGGKKPEAKVLGFSVDPPRISQDELMELVARGLTEAQGRNWD